ncbi:hypothetical protein AB0F15_25665 [Amycolatopsis sp. NPDC026612]|uniref:hypothetical protein n=1 Tax=Amycolatopsis sp. NPDC026612 TaxID=3155466 RepID=UPI0033F9CB48
MRPLRGDSKGGIKDIEGPQAQVLLNKAVGDGFRDDVAEAVLRERGRTVVTDAENRAALTFQTPYGERVLDLAVYDKNGKLLDYVETKTGGSPYTAGQGCLAAAAVRLQHRCGEIRSVMVVCAHGV